MKIKCDWCGSWINDFDQVCPNCGGVNNNYNRHANGVPQTIEELKAWAKEMNLPLEEMRTFIGEDYKGAKAFGIYKDETDGTFVVYKNKEDGTRAVRYKGSDEAYAVNELYQKMKERVAVQKAHQQPKAAKPVSGPTASAQQKQYGKSLVQNPFFDFPDSNNSNHTIVRYFCTHRGKRTEYRLLHLWRPELLLLFRGLVRVGG